MKNKARISILNIVRTLTNLEHSKRINIQKEEIATTSKNRQAKRYTNGHYHVAFIIESVRCRLKQGGK